MATLLNAQGRPEVPSDVLRRLRALDARLGMVFLPLMNCFGVTRDWTDEDPRRAKVKSGEMAGTQTYDLVCYLPVDCPADQAPAFVERGFRRHMSTEDIDRMVDEVQAESEAHTDAKLEQASAAVLDDVNSIVGRRLTNTASSLDVKPTTSPTTRRPTRPRAK